MKKGINRPDAATGTTTAKQERYEKKMAKYRANKARKEQMENEKERIEAIRQENETRRFEKLFVKIENNEFEKLFVDIVKEWRDSHEPCISKIISFDGEIGIIGAFRYGENPLCTKTDLFCGGFSINSPLVIAWVEFKERIKDVWFNTKTGNVVHFNRYFTDDRGLAYRETMKDLNREFALFNKLSDINEK